MLFLYNSLNKAIVINSNNVSSKIEGTLFDGCSLDNGTLKMDVAEAGKYAISR